MDCKQWYLQGIVVWPLIYIALWANTADNKLISFEDNLHEMANPILLREKIQMSSDFSQPGKH